MAQVTKTVPLKERLALFLGLSLQIFAVVFLVRLVADTGVRMVYPFIPQISAGLGLTVVGFSWLIFVRSMAGLSGSLFGILADRYGRRILMAAGLLALAVGLIGVAFSCGWWAIGPMILFGLGVSALIPVQQAYISDQVAYEKRGRALAAVDMSFSLAGIIGLPLVGWLIDAVGWRSPFIILSILAAIAAPLIWFRLPSTSDRAHQAQAAPNIRAVVLKPNVLAAIGVGGFLFLAGGCFLTIWGVWLSEDFNLDAVTLGGIATVISLAEFAGVILSSLFIDRIGKRFGSQAGLLLVMLAFLILPFTQGRLLLAILALVLLGTLVEFTIVSLFPLYSAQAPEAQATVFSLVGVGISIGLALGSPVAAMLWEQVGLWAVCAVAILALMIALFLLTRFLHERPA